MMAEATNAHAGDRKQGGANEQVTRGLLEPPTITLTEVESDLFDELVFDDLQHRAGDAASRRAELVREVIAGGLLLARRARGRGE